jgi:hypothetical protein
MGWSSYNEMMIGREVIDFDNKEFCKKCGKRRGDHLTEIALEANPYACPFVPHDDTEAE